MIDFKALRKLFPASDIEFRVGTMNGEKTKGLALAYVTNRAIQSRLDDVCGAENWKNEYKEWHGEAQICGISIKVGDEWVTKWDGAENTKTEPIKGGLSDSMKRAAVQWGIGRYLYDIPPQWYDVVPCGSKSFKFKTLPKLPNKFLPSGNNGKPEADVATESEIELSEILPKNPKISDRELKKIKECEEKYHLDLSKTMKWAKIDRIEDMTKAQFKVFIDTLQKQYKDVKFEFTTPLSAKRESEDEE